MDGDDLGPHAFLMRLRDAETTRTMEDAFVAAAAAPRDVSEQSHFRRFHLDPVPEGAARDLPKEVVEHVLTYLPDQRERIRATRVSKAFLEARGSYEARGKLWRRLTRIEVGGCEPREADYYEYQERINGYVEWIAFHYSDGSSSIYGGMLSRKAWKAFDIAPDDELVRVVSYTDSWESSKINQISFTTRKGRKVDYGDGRELDTFFFESTFRDEDDLGSMKTYFPIGRIATMAILEMDTLDRMKHVFNCKGEQIRGVRCVRYHDGRLEWECRDCEHVWYEGSDDLECDCGCTLDDYSKKFLAG